MPSAAAPTRAILTVSLELDSVPLDLERVLAMLRVRGYVVENLHTGPRRCTLAVRESRRSPGLLEHRLRRLRGVHVVAEPPSIPRIEAA
jgi:acetolactate synthase regulatory subunit